MTSPEHVLELVHESATNRATCSTSMNRVQPLARPPTAPRRAGKPAARRAAARRRRVQRRVGGIGGDDGARRPPRRPLDRRPRRLGARVKSGRKAPDWTRPSASTSRSPRSATASPRWRRRPRRAATSRSATRSDAAADVLLGGNTKTALCVTVGPALHNYDETFCTLLLATRAMAVKNYARVNERLERPRRWATTSRRRCTNRCRRCRVRSTGSAARRMRRCQGRRCRAPCRAPSAPATSDGHVRLLLVPRPRRPRPRAPTPMPHAAVAALRPLGAQPRRARLALALGLSHVIAVDGTPLLLRAAAPALGGEPRIAHASRPRARAGVVGGRMVPGRAGGGGGAAPATAANL